MAIKKAQSENHIVVLAINKYVKFSLRGLGGFL